MSVRRDVHTLRLYVEWTVGRQPAEERLYFGVPGTSVKNTRTFLWVYAEDKYPYVYEQMVEGNFQPLEAICKLNGWKFPIEVEGITLGPPPGGMGEKLKKLLTQYKIECQHQLRSKDNERQKNRKQNW